MGPQRQRLGSAEDHELVGKQNLGQGCKGHPNADARTYDERTERVHQRQQPGHDEAEGRDHPMPIGDGLPAGFSDEFAVWMRLESRSRHNDFSRGLEARIADPLWMLARQWQTGEFLAEDVGSPIEATLDYAMQTFDRMRLGAGVATT